MSARSLALTLQLIAFPFGAAVWFVGQPWRGMCLAAFLCFFVSSLMLRAPRP